MGLIEIKKEQQEIKQKLSDLKRGYNKERSKLIKAQKSLQNKEEFITSGGASSVIKISKYINVSVTNPIFIDPDTNNFKKLVDLLREQIADDYNFFIGGILCESVDFRGEVFCSHRPKNWFSKTQKDTKVAKISFDPSTPKEIFEELLIELNKGDVSLTSRKAKLNDFKEITVEIVPNRQALNFCYFLPKRFDVPSGIWLWRKDRYVFYFSNKKGHITHWENVIKK